MNWTGRRAWTPAEIFTDLNEHHAEDEESDYEDANRAVPQISFEEFERDPMATWHKFKRQAERPGYISSHRSAFRRLPQYLRPAVLDEAGQAMREWRREVEEDEEQCMSRLLLDHGDMHNEKLDAWLHAQGGEGAEEGDNLLAEAHADQWRSTTGRSTCDGDVEMDGTREGVRQRSGTGCTASRSRDRATAADSGQDDDDSDMKHLKRLTDGIAESVCL